MYTAIAGLLNVLAIYDALEGPAYHFEDTEADEHPAPASPIAPPPNGLTPEAQA